MLSEFISPVIDPLGDLESFLAWHRLAEVRAAMLAAGQRLTFRIQVPISKALLAERATAALREHHDDRPAHNYWDNGPEPTVRLNCICTLVQRQVPEVPHRPTSTDNHNPARGEAQSPPQTQGLADCHSRPVYADAHGAAL
jgi:hypothetical protein